jgi:hypothetical protein
MDITDKIRQLRDDVVEIDRLTAVTEKRLQALKTLISERNLVLDRLENSLKEEQQLLSLLGNDSTY